MFTWWRKPGKVIFVPCSHPALAIILSDCISSAVPICSELFYEGFLENPECRKKDGQFSGCCSSLGVRIEPLHQYGARRCWKYHEI